jgi:hypothetical protein
MDRAASLPVGDRELPLEADTETDIIRVDPLIGTKTEVSPFGGGELTPMIGKAGTITGVIRRFGVVVGYEVKIGTLTVIGTLKDFYVKKEVLEDVQPPTAASAEFREVLSHWKGQRTYWGPSLDGLEWMCFEMASATDVAQITTGPAGWEYAVPGTNGAGTIVSVPAARHDNFWTVSPIIYPSLGQGVGGTNITDHWARTFVWTEAIASGMLEYGFAWEKALEGLQGRSGATRMILRPLVDRAMDRAFETAIKLFPELGDPGSVSCGFSRIRLTPGTVGLTEPVTDRRPYTVITVSPSAAKTLDYLKTVVLHECVHAVVQSRGGEPHNERFNAIAKALGIPKKYRD